MHLTIAFNVAYLVHSFLVITVQGIRKWWVLLATLYGICLFMLYTLTRTCGLLQLYTSTLSRTCGHLQLQHFYSETCMWSPAAVHFSLTRTCDPLQLYTSTLTRTRIEDEKWILRFRKFVGNPVSNINIMNYIVFWVTLYLI